MNELSNLSDTLAALVTNAGDAVVQIRARHGYPVSATAWSGDGLLVTASHVVDQESDIGIRLADGSQTTAELVGRDPSTDLAVLRMAGKSPAPLEPAEAPQVGHLVLALGRPHDSVSASLGIVSRVGGATRTHGGGTIDPTIESDYRPFRGFTGGPLVDTGGRLLGINARGGRSGTVTFPVATLQRVAQALVAHGKIRRGYLGVSTQQVPLPQKLGGELGQSAGLLVVAVEEDSPALSAGLVLGDALVKFGEQPVESHGDLLAALSDGTIGVPQTLTIVRGGVRQEIQIAPGERQ